MAVEGWGVLNDPEPPPEGHVRTLGALGEGLRKGEPAPETNVTCFPIFLYFLLHREPESHLHCVDEPELVVNKEAEPC